MRSSQNELYQESFEAIALTRCRSYFSIVVEPTAQLGLLRFSILHRFV